jgi:hypothetical protein
MADTPIANPWSAPAAELLESHCRQVEAYLPAETGAEDQAAPRRAARPLSRDDLPPVVQALIDRYEANHRGTRLEPLRYVSTGLPESDAAASSDDLAGDVVSLSVTETIVDADQIQVWTRVLIARRTDRSQPKAHRG